MRLFSLLLVSLFLLSGCSHDKIMAWNDGCKYGRTLMGYCKNGGGYYVNYDGWIYNDMSTLRRNIERRNR